jgi:hypothetical protein
MSAETHLNTECCRGLERRRIENRAIPNLKIIVTSRPYWDIEREFASLIDEVLNIKLCSDKRRTLGRVYYQRGFCMGNTQILYAKSQKVWPRRGILKGGDIVAKKGILC